MRIVSVNAWGGAMFDPLIDWVPRSGADILCLQEVTRTPGLRGWTRFADAERSLPQRANLFHDVSGALPDHQGWFVASDAGPIRDPDGCTHRQDFGLATFVDERFPVVGQRAEFVYGDFVDHDDWAIADRPRLASAARILDREDERTITVVHLHGLRDPAGKHDTPDRLAQADALARFVTSVRQPDDLVVVCGDLNLLPDSATFGVLATIGLTDLVGMADTRTSRYTKPTRHANYLLVSDTAQVVNFEIAAEPEVSDHRLLVLDL